MWVDSERISKAKKRRLVGSSIEAEDEKEAGVQKAITDSVRGSLLFCLNTGLGFVCHISKLTKPKRAENAEEFRWIC
jgi:hypothetical protein